MGEKVVYEMARYDAREDGAELIDRVQLVSVGSILVLRDSAGNDEATQARSSTDR
jgi:hypothetical protein